MIGFAPAYGQPIRVFASGSPLGEIYLDGTRYRWNTPELSLCEVNLQNMLRLLAIHYGVLPEALV